MVSRAHAEAGFSTDSNRPVIGEARVSVGVATQEYYHVRAEEIYYFTQGKGRLRIEGEERDGAVGDAVAIPPGRRHKLWNMGHEPLRLACCCAPGYEHDDTVLPEP